MIVKPADSFIAVFCLVRNIYDAASWLSIKNVLIMLFYSVTLARLNDIHSTVSLSIAYMHSRGRFFRLLLLPIQRISNNDKILQLFDQINQLIASHFCC
jgi:hypothetical protein